MDFNDTPEEEAWRERCRAWLEGNAPSRKADTGGVSLFGEMSDDAAHVARAKEWQAKKFDAGFAAITWPEEYGGTNGTPMQSIIFRQEEGRFDVPTEPYIIGLGMIAPTIRTVGTDGQKDRYLREMLRGEEIWCQLFSEPAAGSDVSSLTTSAVRDGDEWVLNGQKVWTSGAHYSDFGEIICRTDPDVPKHRGITAFVVDMKAPGITIRPLRQMTGGASFNEVFFEDVRVPNDNVLGEVNKGWSVAITTLMNERVAIGSGGGIGGGIGRVVEMARRSGRHTDPVLRQEIASLYCLQRVQKFNGMRTLTAVSKGAVPGPEGSIGKLLGTKALVRMGEVYMDLIGPEGIADTGQGTHDFNQIVLGAPGFRVAGGTDEVMKNIIGERVLGLPGEPRMDKDIPFRDLPR
ncbi:MAG: acyl-CoA dehydrogenase family protein [Acidimicrobiia bacterium]|nr:acyl-CoA dehydrogenase family protein [Acidimicrobiia bacterium]